MSAHWVTVHKAAQRLKASRWEILLMALRKELNYRPNATGIEVSEASVRKRESAAREGEVPAEV